MWWLGWILLSHAFSIHNRTYYGQSASPPWSIRLLKHGGFCHLLTFVLVSKDYHLQASTCNSYNHSNIVVMYLHVDGELWAGSTWIRDKITLHPAEFPHGPHPGHCKDMASAKGNIELGHADGPFKPIIDDKLCRIEDDATGTSWTRNFPIA